MLWEPRRKQLTFALLVPETQIGRFMAPPPGNLSITGIENEKRIEAGRGSAWINILTLDRYFSYQEDRPHEEQISAFKNNNRCPQPCRSQPYRSHALSSAPYSGVPGLRCLMFNRHL